MWGESEPVEVTMDMSDINGTIRMVRAVAKVDVGLKINENEGSLAAGGLDNFIIKQVVVRNAMDYGRVVPEEGTMNGDVATATSLPEQTGRKRLTYLPDADGTSVFGKIYLAESANKAGQTLDEKTCVLIEGYYSEDPDLPNTTTSGWYRIDFYDQEDQKDLDVLRNYQYQINITRVDGPGYDSEEKAYNSKAMNITTEILAWEEWDMGDIIFDGQYQLVVNTDSFFFYNNGRAQELKIYTDHPSGWYIESGEKPDWLVISPLSGNNPDESFEVTVSAEQMTTPLADRDGYFYIRSGRMKKRMKVYQSMEADLYIEVTPTTLIFRKSATSPKTVIVTKEPADQPVYFSSAGLIQWLTTGGFPTDGQTDVTEYSFQPTVNTSGNLLTNTVTVFITDLTGKTASRSISVIQLATDIKYEVEFQYDKYPSTAQSDLWMRISAELAWQILSENITPAGILTPETFDVQPAGDNRTYRFALTQNPTFAEREVYLYVTSPEPDFEPLTVTITQDYTRPELTVTDPAGTSKMIDFGIVKENNVTPLPVSLHVNSDWKFSTGTDYDKVVASSDIPVGTDQTGGMPNEPVDATVYFTPFVYQPVIGTPAEGTIVSTTATFTTTNHLSADAFSQSVTFQTIVPPFFDHTSVKIKKESGDTEAIPLTEKLDRTSHNYYMEATSNTAWSGQTSLNVTRTHTKTAWGTHSEVLQVAANTEWEERDITFFYTYDGEQKEVATYTQKSYHFDRIEMEYDETYLKGFNRTYTFTVYGSIPNSRVRIKTDLDTEQIFAATEESSSVELRVPQNRTGDLREVTFSYSLDNGTTWKEWGVMTQNKGNKRLSTGVYVAIQDINAGDYIPEATYNHYTRTTMSWNEAMGIEEKFNTEAFNGSDADGNYVATQQTGCAAYAEARDPAGTWRLPTAAELEEIHYWRSAIDIWDGIGLPILSTYWSQDEVEGDAGRAHSLHYPVNQAYTPTTTSKTAKATVRCVSIDNTHEEEIQP
ncbi:MAG: hypothetical protein LIP06_00660 [Tannerellaceae bacterium]|nr:hypothetical protein [Tannerellaceae bacterium]